jgi:predicted metal-dependent phosphoesterase TrpH
MRQYEVGHVEAGDTTRHLGRADLHIHTTYSDGLVTPEQLLDAATALGLDVIAVTDHDTVEGAWRVRELAAQGNYAVEVIVGIEVTTARGMHLLGLFVEKPLRMYQPVVRAMEQIVAQGGLCLAPHPLSPLTPSLGRGTIDALLAGGHPLVAVETANPTPAGRIVRRRVAAHNVTWQLAEFGGSDAHFLPRVGSAYTTFPGRGVADLHRALLDRTTAGHTSPAPLGHVPAGDYARQLSRSMIRSPARKIARGLRALG